MAKILALFVLALAMGSCVVDAQGLMQKIGRKFNRRNHHGGMGRPAYGHHQQQGGSASAAASAAATGGHQEPEYNQPEYYPNQGSYYQQAYQQPSYFGSYQEPIRPVYTPRYQQHHQSGSGSAASSAAATSGGSSSASGAAAAGLGGSAASAASAAAAAAKPKFHVPPTPYVNHHHYPQFSRPTYHRAPAPQLNIESEIAAATNAAAASSTGGKVAGSAAAAAAAATAAHQQGAHIPAQYGTQEVWRDEAPIHYVSPAHENVHAAASGVYGADTGINENSYYKKSAEEERNHEDGSEEGDHYLQTKSHGRAGEENLRIRQGRDDFDQEIGPYSVKTKKRNNFNFVDYNKSESETGSSVLQKDRHRSSYNKDTVKSREEIDAASTKYANGRTETSGLKTKSYVDDEDSEYYDSAGVHGQAGYQGGAAAAASAAAAAGNSASSSSSSGAGRH